MQYYRRKPVQAPPAAPVQTNTETSAAFEMDDLPVLFAEIAELIPSGFGAHEIDSLVKLANTMEIDDEKEVTYPINYVGIVASFTVSIFLDDFDSPDVTFFAPPALTEAISQLIDRFNEKRGR